MKLTERLILAFRLLMKVISDPAVAEQARQLLGLPAATPRAERAPARPVAGPRPTPTAPAAPVSTRSDALTLLSVLQREARLVDFLKEDITAYADAQIGAAVRDVHRDAAAALERLFALRPVLEQPEGADVSLPAPLDANKYRLVGNLGAATPASGKLQHPGWRATKSEVPQFTGSPDSAMVVAPAEVEV